MFASNYIHILVEEIVAETDKAFLCRLDEGWEEWIPFSHIADYDDYDVGDKDVELSITEWIAKQKGIEV